MEYKEDDVIKDMGKDAGVVRNIIEVEGNGEMVIDGALIIECRNERGIKVCRNRVIKKDWVVGDGRMIRNSGVIGDV